MEPSRSKRVHTIVYVLSDAFRQSQELGDFWKQLSVTLHDFLLYAVMLVMRSPRSVGMDLPLASYSDGGCYSLKWRSPESRNHRKTSSKDTNFTQIVYLTNKIYFSPFYLSPSMISLHNFVLTWTTKARWKTCIQKSCVQVGHVLRRTETSNTLGTQHVYCIWHEWWGCGLPSLYREAISLVAVTQAVLNAFQHQQSSNRKWLCHSWNRPREGLVIPMGLGHWDPWHSHAHVNNTGLGSSPAPDSFLLRSVCLVLASVRIMPFILPRRPGHCRLRLTWHPKNRMA